MSSAPEDAEDQTGPPAAILFCGLITTGDVDAGSVLRGLEQAWGPLAFVGRSFPFDYTTYYHREMGSPLFRRFVTFQRPVEQDALPGLKQEAMRVEAVYRSAGGGRKANIDPGLLLPERLLLATTKPAAQRPYLGRGVYADLTLVYHAKSYRPLDWTYPDYAADETVQQLNRLRRGFLLRKRLEEKGGSP